MKDCGSVSFDGQRIAPCYPFGALALWPPHVVESDGGSLLLSQRCLYEVSQHASFNLVSEQNRLDSCLCGQIVVIAWLSSKFVASFDRRRVDSF